MKLVLGALAIAALAVGLAYWWWASRNTSSELPQLYGNVDIREANLAFQTTEHIAAITVDEGDKVVAGEVLASLDTGILDAQVAAARAAIAAQQAQLDKLLAGTRPEEIAGARATVSAAQADAAFAAAQYRRLNEIAQRAAGAASVSQSQIDSARSAAEAATAKVDVSQKALDLLLAGATSQDIAQARALVEQAKAQLALLEQQKEDATMLAPSSGIVLSRLAEPGEIASPSRPVISLAITSPKWVRAFVSEVDLGKLHPGMRAAISVDSFPERTFPGWVGFISPVAEFTPKTVQTTELRTSLVYEVRVFVDDPDDDLRLGMPATVALLAGPPQGTQNEQP